MLYVLLLPQSDTHAPTKREHLGRILALLPEPVPIPERLDAAFDGGGVSNFSTAKSWSPALLRFLARLAVHLKGSLTGSARRSCPIRGGSGTRWTRCARRPTR